MADGLHFVSEPELERALTDLGRHLAYPPTPNLAASVRSRLEQRQPRRRPFWEALLPVQRRVALALVALLVIAVAVLAVSPEARTAVADRLGLRGVQIGQVPAVPTLPPTAPQPTAAPPTAPSAQTPVASSAAQPAAAPVASPSPQPASAGARLNLGERLRLDEARGRVAFQVMVPTALGAPDETYLLTSPPGGQVALVYYARPDLLPQASTTGVGLLLTEFQADVHTAGPFGKGVPSGTRLEEVQVNGGRGYWIEGDPHAFFFRDARGQVQTETTRLAGNVLLWEQGSLTLRLESSLPKDTSLSIAASVQ